MKITVISDTHGLIEEPVFKYLAVADEIWHAGDIGNIAVIDQLKQFSGKNRIVFGNIDDHKTRSATAEFLVFKIASKTILITHIAGNPPRYNPKIREWIKQYRPDILVAGHSHILKVIFDKINNLLFINPGSCGSHGFHKSKTIVQFELVNNKPQNMNVIELGHRGRIISA